MNNSAYDCYFKTWNTVAHKRQTYLSLGYCDKENEVNNERGKKPTLFWE